MWTNVKIWPCSNFHISTFSVTGLDYLVRIGVGVHNQHCYTGFVTKPSLECKCETLRKNQFFEAHARNRKTDANWLRNLFSLRFSSKITNCYRCTSHWTTLAKISYPTTITNHAPRIRSHTCVAVKPTFTKLSKSTTHSNFHHPPFPRRTYHLATSKTRSNYEPNLLSKCRNPPISGISLLLHKSHHTTDVARRATKTRVGGGAAMRSTLFFEWLVYRIVGKWVVTTLNVTQH